MRNDKIDSGREFDWGRASKDYAQYRDIYPEEFYKKLTELGLCVKGQRVLDLGTGTGVLPRNMYKYGAEFTGADISENQIAEAKRMSAEAGMDIKYVVSPAEMLDFPESSFDVVTACQCFMYFDKSVLLPKIYNMLKPGGRLCILFMNWLPYESDIAMNTEKLVLKYNPLWSGKGMKRAEVKAPEWSEELFEPEHTFLYVINVPFTRKSWHGRIRACRGIGASSLTDEEIAAFEKEHMEYLDTLPEKFEIPHEVRVIDLRKRKSFKQR